MKTRTRYFLLTSGTILFVGLFAGFVAYFAGGLPAVSSARAVGPEELRYVPSEASLVAYANVREVMLSELRTRLRARRPEAGRGHQEFLEQTGIDLENDIDHLVGCTLPDDVGGEGFVLARGRFDDVRLEAFAREHDGVVDRYRDTRVVHRDEGTLAFVEPGLLLFGGRVAVQRGIDTAADGGSVAGNVELMRLVNESADSSHAWAVGRMDALTGRARLPQEMVQQMPAIQWFAASGRVNGGVVGSVRAEARDAEAADGLREVVQGFLALARLQSGGSTDMQKMLQSLQLGGTGNTVSVSFSIPLEMIDALATPSEPEPLP